MRAGRSVPSFVASFALLLSSLIAACGGSGDGGVAPPAAVATVSVSLAASSLVAGQATQATAALKDAGGTTLSGRAVTWSTSNTGTATVDANGLVSAVAAGVVNIIATSEGRSGQASLTVSEPLQVTGLTLLTPGGLALDLGNVAGIIQVSADVQVPAGFKGTREVTIGGVSFAKDSLHAGTALTAVAGTPNVMVAALTSTIPVNTSQVVTTITAQELDCAPVSPNGVRNLVLTVAGVVPGGTPVSASQQASLTLNNAPSVRLFGKPARTLTLVDGRRVWAGDVSLWAQTCDYDAIPTELIDRIEVLTGTAAGSVYGSDAIAGVVNVITRQGAEVNQQFTLSASQLNLESAEPGHRFYLNSFRYKGVTYNPRQQLQWESATPYVTSLDGSGFATPSNLAPNYQLPVNLRYQAPGPVPPVLSAGNWEEISAATVRFDNVGPAMSTSGGFTAPTANVNVGQSVFLPSGIRGLRLNYLGPGIAGLPDFVTPSAFADGLTGLSPSANWKFFASSDLGTIFDANKQITSASQIGASTTRSTYLGLEIPDEIGNVGRFIATTNPGNPYTTGEQLASAPYDSPAVFGRLTDGGVTALVNPPGFRAFNQSNINSVSPGISVSGSRYGSNSVAACAGFWTGTQFRYFRGSPSGGNPCSAPEIVGGTAGAGNTSISYTFTPSGWVNRAVSLYGGTGEGLYQGYLRTYDLGGNIAAGGYSSSPFSFFYDITKPTSSLSAATIPPVAGQTVSITTRSQDNLGVERYWVAFGSICRTRSSPAAPSTSPCSRCRWDRAPGTHSPRISRTRSSACCRLLDGSGAR